MSAQAFQIGVAAVVLVTLTGTGFEPPRFRSGAVPSQTPQAVGGGQVFLEVRINQAGTVDRAEALRVTPPFTALVDTAVLGWRFEPAIDAGRPVESRALVAAVFRAPTVFNNPTLGTSPQDLTAASEAIPFPTTIDVPMYPPMAFGDGVVLVEVRVGADGLVDVSRVAVSASQFDDGALQAARRARFRPARRDGRAIPAFAYLLFGFRAPVVSGTEQLGFNAAARDGHRGQSQAAAETSGNPRARARLHRMEKSRTIVTSTSTGVPASRPGLNRH